MFNRKKKKIAQLKQNLEHVEKIIEQYLNLTKEEYFFGLFMTVPSARLQTRINEIKDKRAADARRDEILRVLKQEIEKENKDKEPRPFHFPEPLATSIPVVEPISTVKSVSSCSYHPTPGWDSTCPSCNPTKSADLVETPRETFVRTINESSEFGQWIPKSGAVAAFDKALGTK